MAGQSAFRCLLTVHSIIDHSQKPSGVKFVAQCHSVCEYRLCRGVVLLAGILSANLSEGSFLNDLPLQLRA